MSATPHALQRENEDLRARLARSEARNTHLHELLRQALRHEFGASTEIVSAEQARLFDELDGTDDEAPDASPEPIRVESHERKRRGRPQLSADLPRVEVVHDLTDAEKICAEHGCELTPIGDVTSEELEFQPATLHVLKHIRKKYTCPCCVGHVVTAAKPPSMIEKSIATPGLLSWVVVSKFHVGCATNTDVNCGASLEMGVGLPESMYRHWFQTATCGCV